MFLGGCGAGYVSGGSGWTVPRRESTGLDSGRRQKTEAEEDQERKVADTTSVGTAPEVNYGGKPTTGGCLDTRVWTPAV